jgi:hypothetical protein
VILATLFGEFTLFQTSFIKLYFRNVFCIAQCQISIKCGLALQWIYNPPIGPSRSIISNVHDGYWLNVVDYGVIEIELDFILVSVGSIYSRYSFGIFSAFLQTARLRRNHTEICRWSETADIQRTISARLDVRNTKETKGNEILPQIQGNRKYILQCHNVHVQHTFLTFGVNHKCIEFVMHLI